MGSAGSKAAGRSYNAVQAGSASVAGQQQQLTGSLALDAARGALGSGGSASGVQPVRMGLTCVPLLHAAAQHVQRPSLTLEQEEELEGKDAALGSLLDRLGGSIHGKALHITPSKVTAACALTDDGRNAHVFHTPTPQCLPCPWVAAQEQLQAQQVPQVSDSSGRLPPDALRQLLELQAQASGGPLQADALLHK